MIQRPTPVTVFGSLNIAFGVLGIVSAPFTVMKVLNGAAGNSSNPVDAIFSQPFIRNWILSSEILGFAASLVILAGGVGLLQLKPWGRTLSIGSAIYYIIMGIVGIVMTMTIMMPAMTALVAQVSGSPDAAQGVAISGTIGVVGGSLFGLIYNVLLLIYMTRPYIIQAFQSSGYETVSQT